MTVDNSKIVCDVYLYSLELDADSTQEQFAEVLERKLTRARDMAIYEWCRRRLAQKREDA